MRRALLQTSSFAVNPAPDPTVELFTLMRTKLACTPVTVRASPAAVVLASMSLYSVSTSAMAPCKLTLIAVGGRGEKCLPAHRARLVRNPCRVWQRILRARSDRSRHRFVVERIPRIPRRKRERRLRIGIARHVGSSLHAHACLNVSRAKALEQRLKKTAEDS